MLGPPGTGASCWGSASSKSLLLALEVPYFCNMAVRAYRWRWGAEDQALNQIEGNIGMETGLLPRT